MNDLDIQKLGPIFNTNSQTFPEIVLNCVMKCKSLLLNKNTPCGMACIYSRLDRYAIWTI